MSRVPCPWRHVHAAPSRLCLLRALLTTLLGIYVKSGSLSGILLVPPWSPWSRHTGVSSRSLDRSSLSHPELAYVLPSLTTLRLWLPCVHASYISSPGHDARTPHPLHSGLHNYLAV